MIDCSKTENYFAEKRRMTKRAENGLCKLGCSNCPLCVENNNKGLSCTAFEMLYPEKVIEIVQKWSNEHPRKTYLMDFLKKYPNAPLEENGTPRFCPYNLGYMTKEDCYYMTTKEDFDDCLQYCKHCWNTSIESEEK